MRPDLFTLTDDILVELTNVGTVRRARKEQDAGTFTFVARDGVVIATDGDLRCELGTGPFDTWICSCPTGSGCRHLVRAVLDWQAAHADQVHAGQTAADPTDADPTTADPTTADLTVADPTAADLTAADRTAADLTRAGPVPTPDLVEVLPPAPVDTRTAALAEKIEAAGLVAEVTATATLAVVRLLHPEHLTVRFLVGRDPRYARCECDTSGCVHLALATRALQRLPGPGRELVSTTTSRILVADDLREQWRAWLAQLVDLGLPAAAELMAGAVRLAGRCENAGLAHPGAVLRAVAEQLELRLDHNSRLSPQRLLELIGEFEARLRALDRDNPELPPHLVAGTRRAEIRGGRSRLVGLGAEYAEVGGWHTLRCHLLDTRTSALRTVTVERAETVDRPLTPADLASGVRGGVRMLDFAAARGLLPSSRRVGDELVLPRGRWSVLASPTLDLDERSPALVGGIALTGGGTVPSALGPRRPADAIGVVRIRTVAEVRLDGDTVSARVSDPDGSAAVLRSRPDDRAEAHDLLLRVLRSGTVTALAGRWRRAAADAEPEVDPTALWYDGGLLLPQLGIVVGEPPAGGVPVTGSSPVADPWQSCWTDLTEVLGRVLLTGARRGSRSGAPALERCANQAESSGMLRIAALVRALAELLPRPADRLDPLLDLCVLLALRD